MANPPPDTLEPAISRVICAEETPDESGTTEIAKEAEGGEVEDSRNDFKVTCVICDLTYGKPCPDTNEAEKAVMLACGHIFGHNCIRQWLDQRDMVYPAKCPYCRFPLQFKRCKCLLVPLLAHMDYTPASIKESEIPDECYECEYLTCEDRLWHREMGRIDVELEDLEWKLRKAKSDLEESKMPKVEDVILEVVGDQPVVDITVEDSQSEKDITVEVPQPEQEMKMEMEVENFEQQEQIHPSSEQPEQDAPAELEAEQTQPAVVEQSEQAIAVEMEVETENLELPAQETPAEVEHESIEPSSQDVAMEAGQTEIFEELAVMVEMVIEQAEIIELPAEIILVEHEDAEPTSQDVEMELEPQNIAQPDIIEPLQQDPTMELEVEQSENIELPAQAIHVIVESQIIEPPTQDATVEMEVEQLSTVDPEKADLPSQTLPPDADPEKDLIIIIPQPPTATEPPAPPKTEEELILAISDAETAIKTYEDKAFEKLKSVERRIAEKRTKASNGKKFLNSWRVSWRGVQMLRDMDDWPKEAEGGDRQAVGELERASEWLTWRRESRGRAGEAAEEDNDEDIEDDGEVDDEEGEKAALEAESEVSVEALQVEA